MASIQSAPNLPQGGAVLPPNFNTNQISEIYAVSPPGFLPGRTAHGTLPSTILGSARC